MTLTWAVPDDVVWRPTLDGSVVARTAHGPGAELPRAAAAVFRAAADAAPAPAPRSALAASLDRLVADVGEAPQSLDAWLDATIDQLVDFGLLRVVGADGRAARDGVPL